MIWCVDKNIFSERKMKRKRKDVNPWSSVVTHWSSPRMLTKTKGILRFGGIITSSNRNSGKLLEIPYGGRPFEIQNLNSPCFPGEYLPSWKM
jgi:hypothetical protein